MIACRLVPAPEASTQRLKSATARLAADRDDLDLLEGELAVGGGGVAADRIAAGEAGVAMRLGATANRFVDTLHRQLRERLGAQSLGHFVDRAAVGDHLLA